MKARIIAFGCVHAPFTPADSAALAIAAVKDAKPTHIVCTGDLFEAAAASVHEDEHQHDLLAEYLAASTFLEVIEAAAPRNVVKSWTLGNHDDNIQRQDARRIPKGLRASSAWMNSPYSGVFGKWRQYPYVKDRRGVCSIGPVHFYHGFDFSANSDNTECVQMRNAIDAPPGDLFVRSHTHRPIHPTRCMMRPSVPLPWWYMNVGTLGPLKPQYMERRDTALWGAGVALIEIDGRKWSARLTTM